MNLSGYPCFHRFARYSRLLTFEAIFDRSFHVARRYGSVREDPYGSVHVYGRIGRSTTTHEASICRALWLRDLDVESRTGERVIIVTW